MFQALLICFREGLEAFLVMAMATLCLRKAHKLRLPGAVRGGGLTALLACGVLGVVLAHLRERRALPSSATA